MHIHGAYAQAGRRHIGQEVLCARAQEVWWTGAGGMHIQEAYAQAGMRHMHRQAEGYASTGTGGMDGHFMEVLICTGRHEAYAHT